jgi:cytosine/adenosine deaminase-related metal-dependent hydrolase
MSIFYKSDLIITNDGPPIRNGIVEVNEDGVIISVFQDETFRDYKFLEGILIPGLVNAHCHLELSHLENKITPRHNGMAGFIDQIFSWREKSDVQECINEMLLQDKKMFDEGIVAVGDISNSAVSIEVKKNSRIHYHTFVEVMGMSAVSAQSRFDNGVSLVNQFIQNNLTSVSLALHAPYSISKKLMQLVNEHLKNNSATSIHINESNDELLFCKSKSGPLKEVFEKYKLPVNDFDNTTNESILIDCVQQLNNASPFILVHNVKTTPEEIAKANRINDNLYWCLCVNANEYITGETPDLINYNNDSLNVVIGTDSLASNKQLSVWEELKTINKLNNQIPFERFIKWATINGARALQLDNKLGKIKPGYAPGLVQVSNIDFENPVITDDSFTRIVKS